MAGKASVPCNAVVIGYSQLYFNNKLYAKQYLEFRDIKVLKYSCEYPVTTALQGTLALLAIPWLKVAGATYFKIGNCDLGSTECSTTA